MKRILLSLIFIGTLSCLLVNAQNTLSDEALSAYENKDYQKSIELYSEAIQNHLKDKKVSAKLYYNLGNAFYKNGEIAKAILNYERAIKLNPSDSDIRFNLDFARSKLEDKESITSLIFIKAWFLELENLFTINTWAMIAILSFACLLICCIAFFFARISIRKKIFFYGGIFLLLVCVCSNVAAFNLKSRIERHDSAVVMPEYISVYSSPDRESKELFQLHKGSTVKIKKEYKHWSEIEFGENVGWVDEQNIEKI